MKLNAEQLRVLVECEVASLQNDTLLTEGTPGPRMKKQAVSAVSEAVSIIAKRASLLERDITRLKRAAHQLASAGFSWNDSSYRSLLTDIGDAERSLAKLYTSVHMLQRDAERLAETK